MEPKPVMITATWITLNLLPLVLACILGFVLNSWWWSIVLGTLYVILFIPYGFFVSLPLMTKIFRKPSSSPGKH